ncbi:MAG: HAD family hydrolase [Verrucomicrobiae bacterium]|nr:HAD family hydrolase [Verrucomicrobiae bacterium]
MVAISEIFRGYTEFCPHFKPRPGIRHVLIDFDGTLSLIREGWPEVMIPMFVEFLPRLAGETEEDARRLMTEDVMRLNGKQTIYQMIQFAERVKERGGTPQDPLWYKYEYLRRLDVKIADRKERLKKRLIATDDMLVYNARQMLESLLARGFSLYLASGTDEFYVHEEAKLLDVDKYFGNHIYGAIDDYKNYSKKMVIDRILNENKIDGSALLAIGDGYVEIQNTKEVGGLAIAVASDEAHNGSGNIDQWKRQRLLSVGADVVIADYRDAETLIKVILGEISLT